MTPSVQWIEVVWVLFTSVGLFFATMNWWNARITREALARKQVDGTFADVQLEIVWQDGLRAIQLFMFTFVGALAFFDTPDPVPSVGILSFRTVTIFLLFGAIVVMDYNTFRNWRFNQRYKPLREEVKKSAN